MRMNESGFGTYARPLTNNLARRRPQLSLNISAANLGIRFIKSIYRLEIFSLGSSKVVYGEDHTSQHLLVPRS